MTKRTILLATLAASLVTAAPAGAQISSALVTPGREILATDQPVPLRLKIEGLGADVMSYTYQAYVWPSGDGPTLETVPVIQDDPRAAQYVSGTANTTAQARWAAKPGTYWIGLLATAKPKLVPPTPPPCPPLPTEPIAEAASSTTIACPLSGSTAVAPPVQLFEGVPHSKVTVHPALTVSYARFLARQKAYRTGWRATAPLTCVAPFVPSAYACTFRWHTGEGRLVKRTLTVTQDTTSGRVTVKR